MMLIFILYILACVPGFFYGSENSAYGREARSAKKWFEENIPQNAAVLINPGTIPFGQPRLFQIIHNDHRGLYFLALARYLKNHPEENYEFLTADFNKNNIPVISNRRIRYMVLTELDFSRESKDWLAQNAILLKGFSKERNTWRIRIYKVLR